MESIPNIKIDNLLIPYHIIKSKRKSLTLLISPDGKLIVKSPTYLSKKIILNFVDRHTNWIKRKYNLIINETKHYDFQESSLFPFLGSNYLICYKSDLETIEFDASNVFIPIKYLNNRGMIIKWYVDKARRQITDLCDFYTKTLGVEYNKIFIKSQRTRWGSCSSKNNLNFNWRIILLSNKLIEYLVIHEVCHIIHMNHSNEYWELVEKLDPLFVSHRKELMKSGYLLTTFLI